MPLALTGGLLGGLAQGGGGVGLQFEHENLLGLAVMAPLWRGSRLACIAASERQFAAR